MDISKIFNASLIYATIRSATPIIYAAICASVTQHANITNIGTEGIMLIGAFSAVATSFFTGSWVIGVLVAMFSGFLLAMLMGVGHIKYHADITAIGTGINMFALALTKFLLNALLGESGSFSDPAIVPIPRIQLPFLEKIPFLNSVINNWAITEWFAVILIFVMAFFLYKTVWGLRLRSVGKFELAAKTAGIRVNAMKYQAIAISGIIGGLAGAHLSLGYSKLFTENMTNGRGFMGVAAMFFGGANPLLTSLGALVFGFTDSVGARLQAYGVPSQFILMMPYIITVTVLAISMATKIHKTNKQKSSLWVKSN